MKKTKSNLPMTIEDARLGVLRRDRGDCSFTGKIATARGVIDINIEIIETPTEQAIERARNVARTIAKYTSGAKQYASRKLLRLKNGTWEDETTPLSDLQFRRRLTLQRIDIAPDLAVTFWFGDGDLFWGHSIQVEMSPRDRFRSAELLGGTLSMPEKRAKVFPLSGEFLFNTASEIERLDQV
jgi:hypothetical protein